MVNIHEMFENQFNVCKSTQTFDLKNKHTKCKKLKKLSAFDLYECMHLNNILNDFVEINLFYCQGSNQ